MRFGGLSISRVMLPGAPGTAGLDVLDLVEPRAVPDHAIRDRWERAWRDA